MKSRIKTLNLKLHGCYCLRRETRATTLRLARKGNCEAYEELIGYYGPALKGWIRKYCRGNDDLAEEIYSITIIKCWSKIKKFKGNSKFSTWANAIARNAFLDEFRKKKKCKLIDIENVAFLGVFFPRIRRPQEISREANS